MKISVIIPVYNVEDYLDECIKSVIMQTYKDIEVLLINDGSTDNSKLICEEYSKRYSFIKVINKKNEGLSHTRNVGIKKSTGDFLIFLDSDDYWEHDFLGDLIKLYNEDKEIDYIFFRYKYFRESNYYFEEEVLKIDRNKLKLRSGLESLSYILENNNNG